MLLAGLGQKHPFSVSSEAITAQWEQFFATDPIPGRIGTTAYGVMGGHDAEGFVYLCMVEVESFAAVPAQLGRRRLQAQEYAVFEHSGSAASLRATWEGILSWLATSLEYESAHQPDFESYPSPFHGRNASPIEIWVSIGRKSSAS